MSLYVDDFKIAGHKANLSRMRKALGQDLDPEDSTPFDGSVYLGCSQRNVPVPKQLLENKADLCQAITEHVEHGV